MSKSIKSNPSQRANLSHHGFDMSQTQKYSSTVGEIIPVYRDFLHPNEKVSISFELESLMRPIKNPSFVSMETCIDVFAVPMQQIYKPFGSLYYGINDLDSSFYQVESVNTNRDQDIFPSTNVDSISKVLEKPLGDFASQKYGHRWINDSARLADALGLPVSEWINEGVGSGNRVSLWFACAYQKIFFDYYRLTDVTDNDPDFYNLDRFFFNSARVGLLNVQQVKKYFTMRYVPYRKDYFTNIFVSPYINIPTQHNDMFAGAVGESMISGLTLDTPLAGFLLTPNDSGSDGMQRWRYLSDFARANSLFGATMRLNGDSFSTVDGPDQQFTVQNNSVASMRALFALDKLAEVTRRAGKHYDQQTLAHFGVDGNKELSGHVRKIGSFSVGMNMQRIVSQAASGDEPLGTMAGAGSSSGRSGKFTFDTGNQFYILMAVQYTRPIVDYFQRGFNKLDQITAQDKLYRPEYDKLGMQPIFGREAVWRGADSDDGIIAWQYRYSEYKTKYDVVRGAFMGSLGDWTIGRTPWIFDSDVPSNQYAKSLYVNPTDLDWIMESGFSTNVSDNVAYDNLITTYDSLYANDPILHMLHVNCFKSSTMSTFGLPDL